MNSLTVTALIFFILVTAAGIYSAFDLHRFNKKIRKEHTNERG